MRDNCVKHADDQYDDLKREAKYEALNIAITAMGRSVPPRWISVEEMLPKRYEHVLVTTRFTDEGEPDFEIAYISLRGWVKEEGHLYGKVTHWMPLPEPPKEE